MDVNAKQFVKTWTTLGVFRYHIHQSQKTRVYTWATNATHKFLIHLKTPTLQPHLNYQIFRVVELRLRSQGHPQNHTHPFYKKNLNHVGCGMTSKLWELHKYLSSYIQINIINLNTIRSRNTSFKCFWVPCSSR